MPCAGGASGGSAAVASTVYRKRPGAPADSSAGAPEDAMLSSNMKRRSMEPPPQYRFSWVARACRQESLRKGYKHPKVQWAIAGLIMGNFTTNIIEKQIDPTGLLYARDWTVIENIWNSVFVLELLWNMSAHWALTVSNADVPTRVQPGRVADPMQTPLHPAHAVPSCLHIASCCCHTAPAVFSFYSRSHER